jgi:hypothetical protein
MSLWTDIIVYSPAWVDVYPEKVRRFISGMVGAQEGSSDDGEIACYGMLDIDEAARKQAADPDIDALLSRLAAQAAKADIVDCDATGIYEPPSWTEMSDTHVGPFFSAEGSAAKVCQLLAVAEKVPFAELEVVGLSPGTDVLESLSFSGDEAFLEFSEMTLEVGPNIASFMGEPPVFAGWLRLSVSGEGQPHPLTMEELIDRARRCDAIRRVVDYAGECFGVRQWNWTVSCKD